MHSTMGILVLFGVGLGIALNQIRSLQRRVDALEDFIDRTFFEEEK